MTRAIVAQGDKQYTTANRQYSATKSLIVAIGEYLRELQFPISGGNHVKFAAVAIMKAEPETNAKYPSAAVFPESSVEYGQTDAAIQYTYDNSTGQLDGGSLIGVSEVKQSISVHVWTQEEPQRDNILAGLEDAFNPSPDMPGLILEMPHYFNLRASFSLDRVTYEDSPDDNAYRYRKLLLSVTAMGPMARMVELPRFIPRGEVEVSGQV